MKTAKLAILVTALVLLAACEEQASRKPSSRKPTDPTGPTTSNVPNNNDNNDQNNVKGAKLRAKVDTRFKVNAVDYTDNLSNQPDVFCRLNAGTEFELVEIIDDTSVPKHVRVKLAKAPGTCTFTEGLLFIAHLECAGHSGDVIDVRSDCLIK